MSFQLYRALQAAADPTARHLSRRMLLQAAVAGAGGLISLQAARAAPTKKLPRVVVIGAGLAGLSCADELAAAGYPVTVLEARGRVGGRVETLHDLIEGKTVEAGGELVGLNQPCWMAYGRRFGFKFVELPWEPSDTIILDGQRLTESEAKTLWREMRAALVRLNDLAESIDPFRPWQSRDAAALDTRSLDDWIQQLDVSPRCKTLLAIQWTGINGLIPAWQSLLGIAAIVRGGGLQKFWDETDSLHCLGGTQQLAKRLAQSLVDRQGAECLRLGTAVHRVESTAQGAVVQLADGTRLTADDVVLTAPPTTWQKIAFDPPLPAALTVPMAASTKFLAVVGERLWARMGKASNAMSNGPVQITWETTAGQGEQGEHALVAFSGGREADQCRGWSPSEREPRYRAELEKFFPGFDRAMRRGRFVDWVSDPWARGTYSFPAPGQVTSVGPLLEAGHGAHVHFAGEHCCYAFTGWMEGGLQSGTRLAARLARRDGVLRTPPGE